MKVGIDCRFAATNSGLGRYTRELVTHLLKREDHLEYVLFVKSEHEPWIPKKSSSPTTYQLLTTNYPHYSFSEQILFPRIIKWSGIDLFFSPHFNIPLRCPVPFIVTIHDLILHDFPHEAPLWKRLAYHLQMRHAIRNSVHIIAVSQYTGDEIRKRYALPPLRNPVEGRGPHGALRPPLKGEGTLNPLSLPKGEGQGEGSPKISVIHEGVSPIFSPRSNIEQKEICKKYHVQPPFFLYVGSNKNHKNVGFLKQAAERAGVRIVCVPESTGNIPDEDLPVLYSAALAFVTASLAEGFCLPAVEALACGCPVIASCRGAIPEITQDQATLIEPTVDAFVQTMQSPPPKKNPIRLYEWKNAAEKTADVFKKQHTHTCHPEVRRMQ